MKTPSTFFLEQTSKFLKNAIDPKGTRILEVGCGNGDVARCLTSEGASVMAIDTDAEAVQTSRSKGVNAMEIDFMEFEDGLFDAIIFTRSLHHIHDLRRAIKNAKRSLMPDGKLILEEFDVENVNEETTRWYYDTILYLSRSDLTEERFEQVRKPLETWEAEHAHNPPLNTGKEMISEIEAVFGQVELERNAYLYRSIGALISNRELGYDMTRFVFDVESMLVKKGLIMPNGIRVVTGV